MRLVLVPKSSPDWGDDIRDTSAAGIEDYDVRTVSGAKGMLLIYWNSLKRTYSTDILTPPTPELLAWAKESKK